MRSGFHGEENIVEFRAGDADWGRKKKLVCQLLRQDSTNKISGQMTGGWSQKFSSEERFTVVFGLRNM
jgi:hypothetical protein